MSALFDIPSLLVVLLLYICTCSYLLNLRPKLFQKDSPNSFFRTCWKATRIGDRLSLYVGAGCLIMAFHLLFIKS